MSKVLIVVNDSWSAYNFRLNLAKELKKAGYKVSFIAPYDAKYSELIKCEFPFYNLKINPNGINPIEDIFAIYKYYNIYKKLQPDIILHYTIKPNIYGTIAAGFLNIATINNIAGLGTLFIKESLITKIAKLMYKFSQKKATKIFFQNRDDFDMFIAEGLVLKEKCDILPGSGVDTDKFYPVKKDTDNSFVFLLIARMLWAKGIQEYIDAAKSISKKYSNVKFTLLGALAVDNPTAISEEQMQLWIEENDFLEYLGTTDNVQEVIAKADCVVLPSYYREGTPRVLLESASMAKPIITTDNVGCKDVVEDGYNGFLCQVKDTKDLEKKMELMLELSEKERWIMGQNGRKKILKEYHESIVLQQYLDVISQILK